MKKKSLFWTIIISMTILAVSSFSIYTMMATGSGEEIDEGTGNNNTVSKEKVEEIQATIGKQNQDVGRFVAKTHDFYNETLGYGGINSVNWNEQREMARNVTVKTKEFVSSVGSKNLKTDLKDIQRISEAVMDEEQKSHILELHRYFHDLDIALNNYGGFDRIWGVTKTLD
ncbi:hypothetical protein [Bacillus marinisedimentorum]|uniref:hypothetical protein n=1 Tax=Bacillus marinisedimentorum TaxID=1821260 RepID=UPI0008733575|nr:hypothetical protein [Bacillus marinisedimentorum]